MKSPWSKTPLETAYKRFANVSVKIPTHPELVHLAEAMAGDIPTNAAWIHVRRGDLLHRTAEATSPENIRRVLQKVCPETRMIYIATDEQDLRFFAPLAEHYELACLEDFEVFKALGGEDNYKLFLVEQAFSKFFPIRISTFSVQGHYFHGCLHEAKGWQ